MKDCIFCKIIAGEINSKKYYEDDEMIIIQDIAPQAKKHYILIPKHHYCDIIEMSSDDALILGKCIKKLSLLVTSLGLDNGFRIVSNKGPDACQSVNHLHIHVLGGEQLTPHCGKK
ncbi:MAG: HIT domain-containing protein [Christensenellaceae bacterium]|jgi:histidine triad (HIT) family protein|nr:HIT domain-containing protein [Christensenellaceae bacterium]